MTQKLNFNLKESYSYLKKQCFTFMYMILLTSLINVGCASNNLSQNQAQQKVTQHTLIEKPALNTENQIQDLTQNQEKMPLSRRFLYAIFLIGSWAIAATFIYVLYDLYYLVTEELAIILGVTFVLAQYFWILSRLWVEANPDAKIQWDKIRKATLIYSIALLSAVCAIYMNHTDVSGVVVLSMPVIIMIVGMWQIQTLWKQAQQANTKFSIGGKIIDNCQTLESKKIGRIRLRCTFIKQLPKVRGCTQKKSLDDGTIIVECSS